MLVVPGSGWLGIDIQVQEGDGWMAKPIARRKTGEKKGGRAWAWMGRNESRLSRTRE